MASMETAPIGASVIDFIHRNDRQAPAASVEGVQVHAAQVDDSSPLQHQQQESHSIRPSLLPCHNNSNILLKGPPKCGRSSIAMDMAHSIAASCLQQTSCRRGTCATTTCTCVAVSILTPLVQNNNNNHTNNLVQEELFPMPCCNVVREESLDFYGQLRALQQNEQSTNKDTPTWNKEALKRIQVYRMAGIRDVLEFLLSVPSNKSSPIGGIVVQGLDVFVRVNDSSKATGELSTEQLMTMTQVLALLADTANTTRKSGVPSFTVLVTMSDGVVPWNVDRLWSTWFPISLKIRPGNRAAADSIWKSPSLLRQEECVESAFVLEQVEYVGSGKRGEERVVDEKSVAHYAIVRRQDDHSDGSMRIVWKRAS